MRSALPPPGALRPTRAAGSRRCVRPRAAAAPPPLLHSNSRWPTGVPPRMGEHVMPSGRVAPASTSTTSGTGFPILFAYHSQETAVSVEARGARPEAGRGGGGLCATAAAHALLLLPPTGPSSARPLRCTPPPRA